MNEIQEILNTFESISLKEMDEVKLLDRMDNKFAFRIESMPEMLASLKDYYRVLLVDGVYINQYETLYYDTHDFNLYQQHQCGKLNRYKVRFRRYVDSGLCFFEIKFKTNKGRTIKARVRKKRIREDLNEELAQFVQNNSNVNPESLRSAIWVYYSRITFVSKTSKERLTIDTNLHFRNNENTTAYSDLVIAEVKQEKSTASPFTELMKQHHIRVKPPSKYCLGIASLFPSIRRNNFKPKIIAINKICYE